jgi:citrate lyase beta subunit
MPGSNARALEKARAPDADIVIMDLDDAMAPEANPAARQAVMQAVTQGSYGEREVVFRLNRVRLGEHDAQSQADNPGPADRPGGPRRLLRCPRGQGGSGA